MAQELETVAQVQQTEAVTPDTVQSSDEGQLQAKPEPHDGIQKRFDEITREKHEAKREAEALRSALEEQRQQTAMLMASMVQRQTAVPQPDPWANIDPGDRQRLEAVMAARVDPTVQQLRTELAQIRQTQAHQEFQTLAAKEDPRVAERAQKLMGEWQRAGLPGWKMTDALIYARGELMAQGASAAAVARDNQGRFAASAQHVPAAASTPPPPAPRVAQGLPADLDRRPLEEQIALLEKHLDGKSF